MNLSILVADSLHINKKNFGSFFKFIEKIKAEIYFEDSHKDWISLYGVYDQKLDKLYGKIEILSKLTEDELWKFKINDITKKMLKVKIKKTIKKVSHKEIDDLVDKIAIVKIKK